MSLFSGDSNATSASESEHSLHSSPTHNARDLPHSAQPAQIHDFTADTDAQDGFSSDGESETDESEDEEPARPNRFKGKTITWQRYTSPDRRIATSLDQMRDSDLSAHLYNVHALKHRVRLPAEELAHIKSWQSRDHWLKKGSALQYADPSGETQTQLVPVKDWTAWPLHPDQLPLVSGSNKSFVSTIGAVGHEAGDAMREELLATFLRISKENWNARESVPEDVRGRTADAPSRSRSRSKSAWSARSQRSMSRTDVSMKDGADQEQQAKHVRKPDGRLRQAEEILEPTMMVDDSKAYNILQPTIQSTLTQLDRLALAIRQTRLNHFGHGAYSDKSSHSEFTSGAESSEPTSRPHSRSKAQRAKSKTPRSRAQSRAASVKPGLQVDPAQSRTAKSRTARRPADSDSSSGSDFVPDHPTSQPVSRKRSRSESAPSDHAVPRDETHRLGLIDWSEILSLAGMIGWDESAVTRTAQRCANLFGESMSFVALPEDHASRLVPQPVEYIPETIPPPALYDPPAKRPNFQPGTLRCPHIDCHRYEEEFKEPYRVIEHCIRAHRYDPRTNDSVNEERRVGAVHIDGFVGEVVVRHGGKGRIIGAGRDGKKGKKKMKVEHEDGTEED